MNTVGIGVSKKGEEIGKADCDELLSMNDNIKSDVYGDANT